LRRVACPFAHSAYSLDGLQASAGDDGPSQADYAFDESLFEAADAIIVEKRKHGARPREDIFDRPILRSKASKRGTHQAPWENGAAVSLYPNGKNVLPYVLHVCVIGLDSFSPCFYTPALIAVQHLSFGSTKVRHLDAIDDVLIANNIANSANGEKTESYNYWWSWQDNPDNIQNAFSRLRSSESSTMFGVFPSVTQESFGGSDFPFSFFGCGNLCGADTSVENDGNHDLRA